MKILLLSIVAMCLNTTAIVGQSANNNNLLINDLQNILTNTQQKIRTYLSSIHANEIIENLDEIIASLSSNLTTVIYKSYSCARLITATTTTGKSN